MLKVSGQKLCGALGAVFDEHAWRVAATKAMELREQMFSTLGRQVRRQQTSMAISDRFRRHRRATDVGRPFSTSRLGTGLGLWSVV